MNDRKKVLVTGASSGIGRATAVRFAEEGWDLCLNARREYRLRELSQNLPEGNHLICPGDYSDSAVAESIEDAIEKNWGMLNVLVNCAGVAIGADSVEAELSKWRTPFDTMINGGLYLTRLSAPLMKEGGRIIHITSIHGGRAEKLAGGYSMAKAALNQYCRVLAVEQADRGILVNAIAPGFVDTEMSVVDGVNELETDWFKENYVEGHHLPLRRAGRPEEIAGVAWFLAGSDSSYITGQVITVDGGLTITF